MHEAKNEGHSRAVRDINAAMHWLNRPSKGYDHAAVFSGFPGKGKPAMQLVFGGLVFHDSAVKLMGGVDWPLMWLQGDPCDGKNVSGMQALHVQGASIRLLKLDGRVVGATWSDADADYCAIAGVGSSALAASRQNQALRVFTRMESVLALAGMTFLHVVRTWFFLDRLLEWYVAFNAVRTAFFQERGVFEHVVPASTGIGAVNPEGSALVAGALAVRPRHQGVSILAAPSPLQCSAMNYRSSFSRAVELKFSDRRELLVSGTASIDPAGGTAHCGDVRAQIELTFDVVNAILRSCNMDWVDATRGIAYFRNMREAACLKDTLRARSIQNFPLITAHATVCREDLLFELELDAVRSR